MPLMEPPGRPGSYKGGLEAVGQHPRGWICALLAVFNPRPAGRKGVQARLTPWRRWDGGRGGGEDSARL